MPNKSGQFTHKSRGTTRPSRGQNITGKSQKHLHNPDVSLQHAGVAVHLQNSDKDFFFLLLLLVETMPTSGRRSDKPGRTGL